MKGLPAIITIDQRQMIKQDHGIFDFSVSDYVLCWPLLASRTLHVHDDDDRSQCVAAYLVAAGLRKGCWLLLFLRPKLLLGRTLAF